MKSYPHVSQGSEEWFELRRGIVTASEFTNIITPTWKPRTGETRNTYLHRKLTEKAIGLTADEAHSVAIEHGQLLEPDARAWFEMQHDCDVQKVGFCTTDDGRIGCSPDGLIGEDGGIEIKCPQPHTHSKYLLAGEVPPQYLPQVHGSMLVTGRAYWYFLSYSRFFDPLLIRVERDEQIQQTLATELDQFLKEFDHAWSQLAKRITPVTR